MEIASERARRGASPHAARPLSRRGRHRRAARARIELSRDTRRALGRTRANAGIDGSAATIGCGMQLTPRKREILRRVVEEYVATGQPVGSRALVERSDLRVSPSTVRGELAELEGLGSPDAPAHLGGAHTDRKRIPGLRRRARRDARGTAGRPRCRPPPDARRDRASASRDHGVALRNDAAARARVCAVARDRLDPAHRGARAAADERDGRRHHVHGRGDQARVPPRGAGRPGARRLGGRVPGRPGSSGNGSARPRSGAASRRRSSLRASARSSRSSGRRCSRSGPSPARRCSSAEQLACSAALGRRRSRRPCVSWSSSSGARPCSSS